MPWHSTTSTCGNCRDLFSMTTAADAPPANAVNKTKPARNRVSIMRWVNDRAVLVFSPGRCQQFVSLPAGRPMFSENAARILKIFKRTRGSAHEAKETNSKGKHMLWTIFVVLLILWLLGFIGQFGGALIHLLLVIAVVVLIINLISGRRSL